MRSYSSEGIVLARKNYGEADRILVVFTRKFGKLSFIAKGIRRPTSRKRGHLEVFNYFKFSASKGRGLDIITEAEVIYSYQKIRKNLKKTALSYYMTEVLGKVLHENEPHEEIFLLMLQNLDKVSKESNLKQIRLEFIEKLLVLLGFWPIDKPLDNPDIKLEEVLERKLNSVRVGKKLLS